MDRRLTERLSPDVLKINPYVPGKPIEELKRERGLKRIIKLASNENPFGPSPHAVKAYEELSSKLNRYPDGYGFELKTALSARFGVEKANLALGNGSSEIIEMMVRLFVRPGMKVILASPSFSIYEIATIAQGGVPVRVPLKDHGIDLAKVASAVDDETALVMLGNPNNPTGKIIGRAEWEDFLRRVPKGLPILLDEAYAEYIDPGESFDGVEYVRDGRPVIVARTFSKAYGLAALRLGYAVAPAEVVDSMNRLRLPFNANQAAQAAALAAVADEAHLALAIRKNREGRARLQEFFARRSVEYIPSQANYVTAKVGSGDGLFAAMLDEGVIIRSMKGFGMPEWVRITVGTVTELAAFEDAFDKTYPRIQRETEAQA